MFAERNKRDTMMALLDKGARQDYVPAAFFLHFDPAFHFGQPAVRKHLEYFRHTGMDFVKIQYERTFPPLPEIKRPEDWRRMPSYKLDFYQPVLEAVQGLVKEAKKEALVLVTLYSPFMCAGHATSLPLLTAHLQENPERRAQGSRVDHGQPDAVRQGVHPAGRGRVLRLDAGRRSGQVRRPAGVHAARQAVRPRPDERDRTGRARSTSCTSATTTGPTPTCRRTSTTRVTW